MEKLSLIVPVHNGEHFIKASLTEYYKVFSKKFKKLEIIVICNACTDNTYGKCKALKKEIPLKILNVPKRGKGYAVIEGFNKAKYNIIGFLDADNPFDLKEILKMIDYLNKWDVVIVTKYKKSFFKYQTSTTRRLFSIGGAIVSKIFFNLSFKDTQGGAKFMKKEMWEKVNNNFICKGFEFDIELLYKLKKISARIFEYYLLPKEPDFSTVKMRILPGIIYRILKLRMNQ